jgi:hypothetical protein
LAIVPHGGKTKGDGVRAINVELTIFFSFPLIGAQSLSVETWKEGLFK